MYIVGIHYLVDKVTNITFVTAKCRYPSKIFVSNSNVNSVAKQFFSQWDSISFKFKRRREHEKL